MNSSTPVSSSPQLAIAALDRLHQHQRIQGLIQQATSLQIAELTVQVGSRNGQVVLALTVGQPVMKLAGLSVDQVGRERSGVAPEQGVGQRYVTPQEADQMQPRQQHDHGVDQPVDGVLPYAAVEQGPIRQRELQMPGDQNRVERLTLCVDYVQ